MAGSKPRVFHLTRDEALRLAALIDNLTPQRIGSFSGYHFVATLAARIREKFPDEQEAESDSASAR